MEYNPVVIEAQSDVNSAYDSGRCDVLTTDASGLAASRLEMGNPDEHIILPEIISKEPLGPAVRQGDTAVVQHRQVDAHRAARTPRSWASPRTTSRR